MKSPTILRRGSTQGLLKVLIIKLKFLKVDATVYHPQLNYFSALLSTLLAWKGSPWEWLKILQIHAKARRARAEVINLFLSIRPFGHVFALCLSATQ